MTNTFLFVCSLRLVLFLIQVVLLSLVKGTQKNFGTEFWLPNWFIICRSWLVFVFIRIVKVTDIVRSWTSLSKSKMIGTFRLNKRLNLSKIIFRFYTSLLVQRYLIFYTLLWLFYWNVDLLLNTSSESHFPLFWVIIIGYLIFFLIHI